LKRRVKSEVGNQKILERNRVGRWRRTFMKPDSLALVIISIHWQSVIDAIILFLLSNNAYPLLFFQTIE